MEDLYILLSRLEIPVAYSHFLTMTTPPFITYKRISSDNFEADNKTYYKQAKYHIELYTKERNTNLENELETLLDNNDIAYEIVSETYIDSEKIYQVVYEITI